MPGLGLPAARRFAPDRGILAGRCTQLCDKTARETPSSTFRRAAFKSKTPPESGRGGALQSIFLIDFRPIHFVSTHFRPSCQTGSGWFNPPHPPSLKLPERLQPVHNHVQSKPHYVHEVPVPRGAFERKVMLRREVPADDTHQ